MRTAGRAIAPVLLCLAGLIVGCASADTPGPSAGPKPSAAPTWTGTAKGSFVVSGESTPLRYAYAVVVRPRKATEDQTHVVLSEEPVPLEVLDDLIRALPKSGVNSVQVALDARGEAVSAFFHHGSLPAGIEVRELTRYVPSPASAGRLAGKLEFQDPGFSWSFSAAFEAPVYRPVRPPSRADDPSLSPRDRARAALSEQHLEPSHDGLRRAILEKDVDLVTLYLDAGIPATSGEPKWSVLYDAVEQGDPAIVKLLLERGANANGVDIGGWPLILKAAADKEPAVVSALLDAGADPNAKAAMNQTALISAAIGGKKANVDLLLKRGAKVNARMTTGTTALAMAVAQGHLAIVKTLIAAGADVARDRKDLLESARRIRNKEIEKAILGAGKPAPKPAPK